MEVNSTLTEDFFYKNQHLKAGPLNTGEHANLMDKWHIFTEEIFCFIYHVVNMQPLNPIKNHKLAKGSKKYKTWSINISPITSQRPLLW